MAQSRLRVGIVLASILATAVAYAKPQEEKKPGTSSQPPRRSDQPKPTRSPTAKPAPPLALKPPPEPSAILEGTDLKKVDGDLLAALARRLYDDKQYPRAIQVLHFATKRGADGGYDLACEYALAGNIDAAFYWLQKSALDEGVDASWAAQDADLVTLRKDDRWSRITPFLAACNAYWATAGKHSTTLVVPTGYKPGTRIGVLVGMHRLGANPEGFASKAMYQELANELKMAVVGVSGTVPRGKRKGSSRPAACSGGSRKRPLYTRGRRVRQEGRQPRRAKVVRGGPGTHLPGRFQRCLSWLGSVRARREGGEVNVRSTNQTLPYSHNGQLDRIRERRIRHG